MLPELSLRCQVALGFAHGTYLRARTDRDARNGRDGYADQAPALGGHEMFEVVPQAGGLLALRSAHGTFLRSREDLATWDLAPHCSYHEHFMVYITV